MHKLALVPLIAGTLVLAGCFTCESPFYEDAQITQDPRMEGFYENEVQGQKDECSWRITRNLDYPGKYELVIKDHSATVELLATLFRVETNLFLDLYPLTDSGVYTPGDVPTVSQFVRRALYEPHHAVCKVKVSDEGLKYWVPAGRGISAALQKAPELKPNVSRSGDCIKLPPSTKQAQTYLRRFADDASVFTAEGMLKKTGSLK